MGEVETDGGEEEREGDRNGDDKSAADVSEEEEEDQGDEDDALGEVVEDGVRCELEESAAVEKGDDRDSLREDALVETSVRRKSPAVFEG